MSSTSKSAPATRMSGPARRELVLEAAARAFAVGGYAGTSTAAIAKEAGVSQPYVVRMFGTKAELFSEVLGRSVQHVLEAFDTELTAVAAAGIEPSDPAYWAQLGDAYIPLLDDRAQLLVFLHGFAAGSAPEIGAQARSAMAEIYTLIRDRSGCLPEQARDFIARGMFIHILLAIDAPAHADEHPGLRELTDISCDGY
ncbi:TetR/AcrR family transcriptional regulator [Tomitella biformata]|uniref:TetR/AcrR family transcriptional regulator n=1 Tax=Tomitella biformata TaxID=630403 RepID=UPI0004B5668F|nr:TetR/AcrR family transcriptional regulator [Tomitella biformata]